jgi:hypothetical protein
LGSDDFIRVPSPAAMITAMLCIVSFPFTPA